MYGWGIRERSSKVYVGNGLSIAMSNDNCHERMNESKV